MPRINLTTNGNYWQAWWRGPDGKRLTKGLGSRDKVTREEALIACGKIDVDATPQAKSVKLSQWFDRFVSLRPELSDTTIDLYDRSVSLLIEYLGDIAVTDVTPFHAAEFDLWLRGKMEPGSACVHIRNCKCLFGDNYGLMRYEIISRSPFARVSGTAPKPVKDWDQVSDDDVRRVIEAAEGDQIKNVIALCAYAGLRRHEALSLRWKDIDLFSHKLIATTTKRTGSKPKRRDVLIADELEEVLARTYYRIDKGEGPCLIKVNVALAGLKAACDKAGVKMWRQPFQSLRRYRDLTWKMKYQGQGWVVDEWLGHSAKVSREHYLTVPEEYYAKPIQSNAAGLCDRDGSGDVRLRLRRV